MAQVLNTNSFAHKFVLTDLRFSTISLDQILIEDCIWSPYPDFTVKLYGRLRGEPKYRGDSWKEILWIALEYT
jgi:hypothetical protein